MKEIKKNQELSEDELDQVSGGKNLSQMNMQKDVNQTYSTNASTFSLTIDPQQEYMNKALK